VYTDYCNNFDRALDVLKELKKNEDFKVFLTALDKDPRTTKLGIQAYLITPIQRIPRYRLLLQDYLKSTDPTHPDYNGLKLALQKICDIADHLNNTMKGIEATAVVIKIQEAFGSDLQNLVEPHRKLVEEGQLLNHTQEKIYIHLFNDILVYSRRRDASRFDYKGQMALCNVSIFDNTNANEFKFKIQDENVELILCATNAEDKQKWLKVINTNVEVSKSARKSM